MEAIAFSTWKTMVPLRVSGISASGKRVSPRLGRDDAVAVAIDHAQALGAMRGHDGMVAVLGEIGDRAGAAGGHLGDDGIGGVQHRHARRMHVLDDDALDHGQVLDRADVAQAQVVAHADVGDDGHVAAVERQAFAQDAAARGLEHGRVHVGVHEHAAELRGPLQSPVSMRRLSTYTPSELVMPTRWPAAPSRCAVRRTVVVLPLVPATATTGMRPSSPSAYMLAMMASPTLRPLPKDGFRCMRRPGAALTSTTPPCCSSSGYSTLGDDVHAADVQADHSGGRHERAAISGWTSSVTSVAEPPVLRLALLRRKISVPGRHGIGVIALFLQRGQGDVVEADLGQRGGVAVAAQRSALTCSTSWRMVWRPSPVTWADRGARPRPGCRPPPAGGSHGRGCSARR